MVEDVSYRLNPGAAFFLVFLCILFGANAIAIKITFTGIGVFTSAALRFCIATAAILVWAKWRQKKIRLTPRQLRQVSLFSIIFAFQLSLFYFGLSKTNASRGTLLINLLPFFVLLLAHFFIPGERITIKKLAGMVLGFSGVAFLFSEQSLSADFQSGDTLVFLATIVWACNTIYLKKIISDFDPFQIVLYSMIISLPVILVEAFIFDESFIRVLNIRVLGALLYQGLVTTSFGFVAWNSMIARYGPVSVHSFVFIMPITGVLLSGLILAEPVTINLLAALVLIVAGILVTHIKNNDNLLTILRKIIPW